MVREGNMVANGWPLGLGNMNSRISRVGTTNSSQLAVAPPPQPYTSALHRCSSFSSFTSSNLDTESTASFFPDQSVSLGRLIGIKPPNKGRLMYYEQHRSIPHVDHEGMHKDHVQNSHGRCAPLLYHVITRIGRNGSSSRH